MNRIHKIMTALCAAVMLLMMMPVIPAAAADQAVPGDVNGDGVCDVQDVYLLRDFLLTKEQTISPAADLDENGKINACDLTLLKRMLPMPESITLMMYVSGADLESTYYEATDDIAEMLAAQFTPSVNVVMQTGGTIQWHTDGLTDKGSNRVLINGDGMKTGRQSSVRDMSRADTLSAFIQDAAAAFPAEHYALIFWGHGMGALYGCCFDQLSRHQLTLPAMQEGIREGGVHFDWIGFDSCLMATAETAFALRDYADYMLASPDTIGRLGWEYTSLISEWAANPGMDTKTLLDSIADKSVSANTEYEMPAAISCLDLSYAAELMDAVYAEVGAIYTHFQEAGIDTVLSCRSAMRDYGDDVYDMVDVEEFAKGFDTQHSQKIRSVLKSMVVSNTCYETDTCGLSFWFFEVHPEDGENLLEEVFAPIGIDSTYIQQMKEMAAAAAPVFVPAPD